MSTHRAGAILRAEHLHRPDALHVFISAPQAVDTAIQEARGRVPPTCPEAVKQYNLCLIIERWWLWNAVLEL